MTETDRDPGSPQEATFLAGTASARGSASGDLTVSGLTFKENQQGDWTVERAKHELRAETTARKLELDAERLRHEIEEEKQDNAQRRHRDQFAFYVVVGVLVGILIVGIWIGIQADNSDTRAWGQSLVTLIVGGIVGGLAGYVTGKGGK
jgi:hypothetical protein